MPSLESYPGLQSPLEQSKEDEHITSRLKDALSLVDVRVLDHFVVGGDAVTSFTECGLL